MRLSPLLPLAILPLALACTGPAPDDGSGGLTVTIQGQYQDLDPTTGATTTKPIRYGYAEVVDAGSNQTLATGYLGASGTASANIASGRTFYVRISAAVSVPNAGNTDYVLQGSVKSGTRPASFANAAAFDAYPDVMVTSDTVSAGNSGTLTLTAVQDSQRRAAAFNAADQMVTYALGLRAVEPSLKLPNLHAFFTTSTEVTDMPAVEIQTAGGVLLKNNRAVFTLQVAGDNSLATNANDDLNDDGVLIQAYAHQLFALRSYPETGAGTTPQSVIRNDNDNGYNDRDVQSEPTLAFQDGFCDFLSGAFRRLNGDANAQLIRDTFINSSGTPAVSSFDLTSHTQFSRTPGQGEFYRGSVAISLWGIWNSALSGDTASLTTLWSATLSSASGAYLNAPLACYPTYLVGLRTTLGSSSTAWSNALFQLGLEDVPNPDAAYFAGSALWSNQSLPIVNATGNFSTYASGIAFDRNQAQSYRFTQASTGPRTITLSTPAPGLVLELFDSAGLYAQTLATSSANGVLNPSSLAPGTYVVRVRVDPFTAYSNGSASYTLNVN